MADTHEEAVDFLRLVTDADGSQRSEELEDLRFRFGDQWPTAMSNKRFLEDRPCLTINETDAYVRKLSNEVRQQRPRIRAQPLDSNADPEIAKVITGLIRHVEENSDAANAYDMATEFAITMGRGYWRMRTDYIREDSFFQDIYVDPVENPFTVYFDPNSSLPDGSDQERCLITDLVRKTAFLKTHPGAMMGGFTARGAGDIDPDWLTKDSIRLAEYFKVERVKSRLIALSNGLFMYEDDPRLVASALSAAGITMKGDRPSYKRRVTWEKVTAFETLEERVLPGRWIPVIPVYGLTVYLDGRRKYMGAVRFAKDPQRMVNFWQTSITESIALAPKAKWTGPAGFDTGFEQEWAKANITAYPILHYNEMVDGRPLQKPERMQPEPPPEGAIMAAMSASQNLQRVLGAFDPGAHNTQRKSDKTINAEAQQTEITNYHFYDNLTRSLKHTGRIALDWTPTVWDTQRVQRIIGDDGRPSLVTVNDRKKIEAIGKVLNDVTVGTYDIVMEVGPGYNSRRQESVAMLMQLLDTPLGEKIATVADDVIVREMDFNGSEVVADRLAAANPLSQIDEDSEIPPQAQMMIKMLQSKLDQANQALQQAGIEIKFGLQKEQIKQTEETKRALMKETSHAHDVEVSSATKRHDVETRALTAQNVEELKGFVKLLIHDKDTLQMLRMAMVEDEQEQRKADQEERAATPS